MWLEEVERLLRARPVRRRDPGPGLTPAAVLVPLYVVGSELWVLLTRRSDSLRHHAGQYSFPGGVREDGDADEAAAALREAHEELGIDPAVVVVLGQLDDAVTPSGFVISPVVGALPHPLAITPASDEVEAVVPIPFSTLANPEMIEYQRLPVGSEIVISPVYHCYGHQVWGATARMISDLVSRLTGVPAERVE